MNGGNVAQNCSNVVADSCKNIARNVITRTSVNIQNDQLNEECGEHGTCSDDSRTISQPVGTRNSHPTFIGKLTIQKKTYRDCILIGSSPNNCNEPERSTTRAPVVLKKTSTHLSPISKENVQEIAKHDSPMSTKITRQSLELDRHLSVRVVWDETPAIRRITRSMREELERQ